MIARIAARRYATAQACTEDDLQTENSSRMRGANATYCDFGEVGKGGMSCLPDAEKSASLQWHSRERLSANTRR